MFAPFGSGSKELLGRNIRFSIIGVNFFGEVFFLSGRGSRKAAKAERDPEQTIFKIRRDAGGWDGDSRPGWVWAVMGGVLALNLLFREGPRPR